jgi:DNA-3-methyladenine glycosylase
MFGPPGRLYVYFTYGMHWCANVVCGPGRTASAVLLRALVPVRGAADMRARRWPEGRVGRAAADRDLCRGPAKLAQALGITREDDGADLTGTSRISVLDDGVAPPTVPARGPRVGVATASDVAWRWWAAGDPHVSSYRRG